MTRPHGCPNYSERERARILAAVLDGDRTFRRHPMLPGRDPQYVLTLARALAKELGLYTSRKAMPWTDPEEAYIRHVVVDLADPLFRKNPLPPGRPRAGTISRVGRMRKEGRLPPVTSVHEPVEDTIRKWHAAGHSCRHIADTLGLHPSTVMRIGRRLGLTFVTPAVCKPRGSAPIVD